MDGLAARRAADDIRGGGDPPEYMAFAPRPRMDPPPRSFAPRCACMHHGSGPDGSTEYKSATRYRVHGGPASVGGLTPPPTSPCPGLQPAAQPATDTG